MMSHHQSSFAASVNHDASHMEWSSTTYNILTSYIHRIYIIYTSYIHHIYIHIIYTSYIHQYAYIYILYNLHSISYNHMNGHIGLWTITTLLYHPVHQGHQGTSWHRWSPVFALLPFPSLASVVPVHISQRSKLVKDVTLVSTAKRDKDSDF